MKAEAKERLGLEPAELLSAYIRAFGRVQAGRPGARAAPQCLHIRTLTIYLSPFMLNHALHISPFQVSPILSTYPGPLWLRGSPRSAPAPAPFRPKPGATQLILSYSNLRAFNASVSALPFNSLSLRAEVSKSTKSPSSPNLKLDRPLKAPQTLNRTRKIRVILRSLEQHRKLNSQTRPRNWP